MRDVYKNDFCDVVRDGSSLALQVSYLMLQQKIIDLRKEVEQAERVRSCIEKLLKENRKLTQMKK